jgi:hypothetical protein
MKTHDRNGQDLEQTMVEHERWTSAILTALHEMRSASAAGLTRWYGDFRGSDGSTISGISPLATSVIPAPPKSVL